MKRPVLIVALLYVSGILFADHVFFPPLVLLSVSLGTAVLALGWAKARSFLLYPITFLAGCTNLTLHTAVISPQDLRLQLGERPHIVTVRGTLRETPTLRVLEHEGKASWRTMAQVDTHEICPDRGEWKSAVGRLVVTTPGSLTNLFGGQTVEVTGVVGLPKMAAAEGTFDYRAYLRELGIYYQLQPASERDWKIISTPAAPPLADRFRAWGRKALAIGLPGEDESLRLEWALTLGWKTALTDEVSEPFVRAATYHIFAVDGLRMAIVFGIFFSVFRAIGVPRWLAGLMLLPLIWFYVALTGWPASAIRATVMLSVIIMGWALKRPTDLLNSLFVAALIILLWEPQQLFQAGFQLSFLVVLSMILVLTPLRTWTEKLIAPDPLVPAHLRKHWPGVTRVPTRYATEIILTSFAAWIGSLPLVAYYFHILTPVSTPANLLAVPLCGLVLASNVASLILGGWFPAAAELFNHAGWALMECIRVTSYWFANWPFAYVYVPAPSLFTSALYYALLIAVATGWFVSDHWVLAPTSPRAPADPHKSGGCRLLKWKLVFVVALVGIWVAQCWRECSVTRLTVLAAGGGTAIYFDAPGTRNDLLVDCGTTNSVQFALKPFLRAQGANRLSALVLTHGDVHHVGGAELVADIFPVNRVLASPIRFRSTAYRHVLACFNDTPGKVRTINRNDSIGPWTVLHPDPADRFAQADDNAIVLRGTFGECSVLLLSDLGRPGQDALLERFPELRADIVVTSLPAASDPLSAPLLDRLQARLIVVQDLEFPVSERCRPKVRERLAKRKVPVIFTSSAGSVTIQFRTREWELHSMSGIRITSRDRPAPLPQETIPMTPESQNGEE